MLSIQGPVSRGTVLVVDDDALVRQVLTDYLVGAGYDTRAADSATAGLALLHAAPADVVLLDVGIPGVNGPDGLERIVATQPGLPVIMLTASADLEKTATALRHGAADYVRKPINLEHLEGLIAKHIAARRAVRPPASPGSSSSSFPARL